MSSPDQSARSFRWKFEQFPLLHRILWAGLQVSRCISAIYIYEPDEIKKVSSFKGSVRVLADTKYTFFK